MWYMWMLADETYLNNRYIDSIEVCWLKLGKEVRTLSLLIMTSPPPLSTFLHWLEVLLGSLDLILSHAFFSLVAEFLLGLMDRSQNSTEIWLHHTYLWQACLAHEVGTSSLSPAVAAAAAATLFRATPSPALGFLLWEPQSKPLLRASPREGQSWGRRGRWGRARQVLLFYR